jgi:hypothetical protein
MGDVYSQAQEVIVWLGDEKDGSAEATEFLGNVVKTLERPVRGSFSTQAAMDRLGVVADSAIVRTIFSTSHWGRWILKISFDSRLPIKVY